MTRSPWRVDVYSGTAYYEKPIDELTNWFQTEQDAQDYIDGIQSCIEKYNLDKRYFDIVYDTTYRPRIFEMPCD